MLPIINKVDFFIIARFKDSMFLFAASRHCEARSSPGIICGQKYDNFGEMLEQIKYVSNRIHLFRISEQIVF